MKNYDLRKILMAILFCIVEIAIEMITYESLFATTYLPFYWWIDIGIILCVGMILALLPYKLQNILSIVLIVFEIVFSYVIICVAYSAGYIFSWDMVLLVGEAQEVMGFAVFPILPLLLMIGMLGIYILFIIINKDLFKYKKQKLSFNFKVGVSTFMAGIFILMSVTQNILLTSYDKDRFFLSDAFHYITFNSPRVSMKTFGIVGYYGADLLRICFPGLKPAIPSNQLNFNYEDYDSILYNVCKDDNVLLIITESLEEYVISKELTPVLYSLKNGIDLTECGVDYYYNIIVDGKGEKELIRKDYDIINGCYEYNGKNIYEGLEEGKLGLELTNYKSAESTNFAEQKILLGNTVTVEKSLPNVLQESGYQTTYMHCNYSSFYRRDKIVERSFGFEKSLFHEDMLNFLPIYGDLSFRTLDSIAINHYLANPQEFNILPEEKFFTCFLTVTTHGGYNDVKNSQALDGYYNFIDSAIQNGRSDNTLDVYKSLENGKLKESIRNFYAKAMDTEKCLALLIDELYKTGRLKDTLICMVTDHYCYSSDVIDFKELYFKYNYNNYKYCKNFWNFILRCLQLI